RIQRERPSVRLLVVGDGVMRMELIERTRALGIEQRVTFAGLRNSEEVSDLLQIADAFLLTSAYEGMPMAALEALGCGVPVVTTAVGEVSRVVRDGVSGRI